MCATCKLALKLSTTAALKLVAGVMKARRDAGGDTSCLDKLVGKLVGFEEMARDEGAEAQWERNRR